MMTRTRVALAISIASFSGEVAGLQAAGLLGLASLGPSIALVGGLAGAVVRETAWRRRLPYVLPFLAFTALLTNIVEWYAEGRRWIATPELFIPVTIALLPFAGVYLLVGQLVEAVPPPAAWVARCEACLQEAWFRVRPRGSVWLSVCLFVCVPSMALWSRLGGDQRLAAPEERRVAPPDEWLLVTLISLVPGAGSEVYRHSGRRPECSRCGKAS